jgi:succinyl-CoA synthetase beta subunit
MDLLEYQGKSYFARFGIPVSKGAVANSSDEAVEVAQTLGLPVVIKAQVKVGGRGKAGGVKLANNLEEVKSKADEILGLNIKGHVVNTLWIEKASEIKEEYYLSFTLDRSKRQHVMMLSAQGGVDIEEVAATNPEAIKKMYVDPFKGIDEAELSEIIKTSGLNPVAYTQVKEVIMKLYECFVKGDAELAEINPLILTTQDKIHALDAKVSLDDDARFRHPEWEEFGQSDEGDQRDKLARSKGLNYVGLDGFVGVIANGAGLAMSTCDVVNQVGGAPANFLDIGGGANAQVMANALEVINTDPNVRSILINIFGGIVRCDEVAKGILQALTEVKLLSPIVIRLDGTNAELARQILKDHISDTLIQETTMMSAAKKAVEIAQMKGSK